MNKKYLNYIILFLLVIILSEKINFFRSVYDIVSLKYHERLLKKHDYCDGTGLGFILDLKKKYDLSKINPDIENYRINPSPKWLFLNTSDEINKDYKIFLNYKPNIIQKFFRNNDDYFISNDAVFDINTIKKVTLETQQNLIAFNGYLTFYNKNNDQLSKIKTIKFETSDFDENSLIVNFSDDRFARKKKNTTTIDPGPLVVKLDIKNDAFKNINKMNIIFDRSKDFEGYEILYQNKDCYFVKKR